VKRTGQVFGLLLVLAVGWEVWTLVNNIPGDTISEVVWAVTHENPIIVLAVGILIGHWFWQRKQKPCPACGWHSDKPVSSADRGPDEAVPR